MIRASEWRPLPRNSLLGFVSLHLEPSGIVLHDCSLHRLGDREWIGLPAKPQVDRAGLQRKDPATAKTLYQPVVEIPNKAARERFQIVALAAVHALLASAEERAA
jgi:hypothetical protein